MADEDKKDVAKKELEKITDQKMNKELMSTPQSIKKPDSLTKESGFLKSS